MSNGNLRERIHCDIDHWPVQVDPGKGISCKCFGGVQGLELFQVFVGARVEKLVSVFIILIFITQAMF